MTGSLERIKTQYLLLHFEKIYGPARHCLAGFELFRNVRFPCMAHTCLSAVFTQFVKVVVKQRFCGFRQVIHHKASIIAGDEVHN